MITVRQFKRHIPLTNCITDSAGFTEVIISEIIEKPSGERIYWVIPYDFKDALEVYKEALNEIYAKDEIPTIPMSEITRFKTHMVMAKIHGGWARASIINLVLEDKMIGLEDIDTGKTDIAVLLRDPIKIPLEEEMAKGTYAFKVSFEGCENEDLQVGDIIKIKIKVPVPFGNNICEFKMEEQEKTLVQQDEPPSVHENRNFITMLPQKGLAVGPNIKILYCDGSKLEQGKLHICESTKENWNFYSKMGESIDAYISAHPPKGVYIPV